MALVVEVFQPKSLKGITFPDEVLVNEPSDTFPKIVRWVLIIGIPSVILVTLYTKYVFERNKRKMENK